jgi:hypothetical protein
MENQISCLAQTWFPPLRGKLGAIMLEKFVVLLRPSSTSLLYPISHFPLMAVNLVTAWLTMEVATILSQMHSITLPLLQRIQPTASKRERKRRSRAAALAEMGPRRRCWPGLATDLLRPARKACWIRCNQCPVSIPPSKVETQSSIAISMPVTARPHPSQKLTQLLKKIFATRNGGCPVFQMPSKK